MGVPKLHVGAAIGKAVASGRVYIAVGEIGDIHGGTSCVWGKPAAHWELALVNL